MKGRTFIGQLSVLAIILLSLFAILFVSCDSDSSSGGSGKALDFSVSISDTTGSKTIDNETWYLSPFKLNLKINQTADISYSVYYLENNNSLSNPKKVRGDSLELSIDEDCSVSISISVGNDYRNYGGTYKFLRLRPVETVGPGYSSLDDDVMNLDLGTSISMLYTDPRILGIEDVHPVIRYTTDGSDPHDSPTVVEFVSGKDSQYSHFLFEESMPRLRVYASLDGWKESPETSIQLVPNKTEAPEVSPDSQQDEIVIGFNELIAVNGHGRTWYTLNPDLTTDTINPEEPSLDPSDSWVDISGGNIAMNGASSISLRLVSKEEGRLFSDIVEKSFRVKLPSAVEVPTRETDGNNMTIHFSRGDGPQDSSVKCYVNGYSTTVTPEGSSGGFKITVASGSSISVSLEKEGYVSSDALNARVLVKLPNPTANTQNVDGKKYKKVYLSVDKEGAQIKYIIDGVEKTYTDYIEIRESTTITFWAEKENFDNSNDVKTSVTVSYTIGDIGPAGGIIVHDTGTSTGSWRYVELLNQRFTGIFGYYAKKDGDIARRVGTKDTLGFGGVESNTELLATTMKGHAYKNRENKVYRPKVLEKIDTFVALSAYEYEKSVNLHDRAVIYDDWYVPSRDEMEGLLRRQKNGEISASCLMVATNYWTSTEDTDERTEGTAYYVTYTDKKNISSVAVAKSNNTVYVLLRTFK